ncbi:Ribonuclease H [Arachis hypogaea]|nr:Ribonuclease H [Arachis hypogaea]
MQSERYPYYAVRKGKSPGIYTTWKECEQQVVGFRNNEYKGFRVLEEAQSWLREGGIMLHEDLPSHGKTRTVYDMDLPRLLIGLPLHQLTSSTMWATDVAVLVANPTWGRMVVCSSTWSIWS